jgi:predicted lysophospholipase L1 biosynthesis ABC-type transport system permease subunit
MTPLPIRLMRHRRAALVSFLVLYGFGFSAFLLTDGWVRASRENLRGQARELLEGDLRLEARRPFTAEETRALAAARVRGAGRPCPAGAGAGGIGRLSLVRKLPLRRRL